MSPLELIGRVAARRLMDARENQLGRVFFCMMGLDEEVTCAIAREVAKAGTATADVEVFVHPRMVVGDVSPATISDKTAPWHRNHPTPGSRLTICTVPSDMVAAIEPTLAHNSKIDDAWLLQEPKVWIEEAFQSSSEDIQGQLTTALSGMVRACVAHDAMTVAEFLTCVAQRVGPAGQIPERAIRWSLPCLRLPRESGDPRMKITDTIDGSERFFRKVVEEAQPALYLRTKDGDPLNPGELRKRLKEMVDDGSLSDDVHSALASLVADRSIHDGQWTQSQLAVAELGWERIEPFFSQAKKKAKPQFGAETKAFFDRQYPDALTKTDADFLNDLVKDNVKPSETVDEFFNRHRSRLQSDPKLYKRWEKLIFRAPIETDDLSEGLLMLAHRAFPETEDPEAEGIEKVLIIRLRHAEKMDFWTSDKNTRILRYLRDRYRGLDKMLLPHTHLDFGRCWDGEWEGEIQEEQTSTTKDAVTLEFEAFLVPADQVVQAKERGSKPHANRAQMTWKPAAEALGLSLPLELGQIRPIDEGKPTYLVTGRISQSWNSKSAGPTAVDLLQRSSVSDAFQQTDGLLANPGPDENRIDLRWLEALRRIEDQSIITRAQSEQLKAAFDTFALAYGAGINQFLRGEGLSAKALISQAEHYGDLIATVMREASQEICIRDLLAPLLSIGVITVDGEGQSGIVTAWHPLRLAEIAAKAHQLVDAIRTVVTSDTDQRTGVEDFVSDRISTLSGTYYADVGIIPGEVSQLGFETQAAADYSLLEPVSRISQHGVTNEPADSAIVAFDRVANEYLKLKPHERANFSVVILNADSENLPLAMANTLARRVEDDSEIRCELVVTDDDPVRLRQVYERQNRRISHEIDSSLASEAARNFLSRLRVGIFSPETLAQESLKANDVVLLQDVIARNSTVRWISAPSAGSTEDFVTFVPTARSKRRPFRKGNTTSALYLTAPRQPLAAQTYVNALRAERERRVDTGGESWLPVQEVEFQAGDVRNILSTAHQLGNWVMTFDRVADRRLIATDERRIIRYFSAPGSTHNVIVSTEISGDDLGDCIDSAIVDLLPGIEGSELRSLRHELFKRASQLSGGVVMRGAQWSNYASELLGLVLSQREIDRLLRKGRENRTGWFFLDDYRDWLDLTGEMADVLAIDFSVADGVPEIRVVVAEAKFVDDVNQHAQRSASQLESTWTALNHRLLGGAVNLDPAIWRHRLADMILEHMEPFDQVGGIGQDEWLEGLRNSTFRLTVDGYSLVYGHTLDNLGEQMPRLPDQAKDQADRRRLAQWVFPRSDVAKALRNLADDMVPGLISEPAGWPSGDVDSPDAPEPVEAVESRSAPEEGKGFQGVEIVIETVFDGASGASSIQHTPSQQEPEPQSPIPVSGPWSRQVMEVLQRLSHPNDMEEGQRWLAEQIDILRSAVQTEGMDAPVLGQRLTPNTGLVYLGGRSLTVAWLERKRTDLLTRYGLDIVRITPMPGQIAVGLRRPSRAILHLADAWLKRGAYPTEGQAASPLLGEKEDDGRLCFLPLAGNYDGQERAAPHSLISGTTGSGKGILVTNLILDLCALNSPSDLELHLIDPKRGVDYAWARRLPHLKGGIIDDQEQAKSLLQQLVEEMDERYELIAAEGCRNIDQYNRRVKSGAKLPRIAIFFDEVANWMQDDDFKKVVDALINKIATKSRAAGFHLFMIYQRADNQVMTMQLRTNLGNKLILRLGDEGSSKIALGESGAERLLGKGHLIAKMDTDEKTYLQVPFIGDDEVEELADAVIETWSEYRREAAE